MSTKEPISDFEEQTLFREDWYLDAKEDEDAIFLTAQSDYTPFYYKNTKGNPVRICFRKHSEVMIGGLENNPFLLYEQKDLIESE